VRYAQLPGADHFSARLEIADIVSGDGSEGFTLYGRDFSGLSGYQVSPAGDINGDGFSDLVMGALSANPGGRDDAGETYVVFGQNGPFPPAFQLSGLAMGDGKDEDFDGNGSANFVNYSILTNFFLLPPGPSGLQPLER